MSGPSDRTGPDGVARGGAWPSPKAATKGKGGGVPLPAAPDSDFPAEVLRGLTVTIVLTLLCLLLAYFFRVPATKFVVAAILGINILYYLARVPEVALFTIIVFLPVVYLLPKLPLPGLNGQTFLALLAIFGTVNLQRLRPGTIPFAGYFWALLIVAIIGSVQSVIIYHASVGDTFTNTKNWLGFLPFFFYSAAASRTPWGRRLVIGAILMSATFVAIHSNQVVAAKGTSVRVAGLIGKQINLYGGYLAMLLPISLSFAVTGTGRLLTRILAGGTSVLLGAALIFTGSRGAWVALVAGLVVLVLMRGNWKLALVIIAFTYFGNAILPESFFDRVEYTVTAGAEEQQQDGSLDGSTETRVKMWRAFPSLFVERPIIGHGMWQAEWLIYRRGIHHIPKSPHSSIIRFGIELGIIGLIIYFSMIAALTRRAWLASLKCKDVFSKSLFGGLLAGFVALMISDCSGTRFFSAELFAVFCLLAGIVAGWAGEEEGRAGAQPVREEVRESGPTRRADRALRSEPRG